MAFNKAKYDIEYKKAHKTQFKVELNKDEATELDELLVANGLTKVQFVRNARDNLKNKKTNK